MAATIAMTEEPGTAFLDIASNLLAVVLIVTLFSLLTLQQAGRSRDDPLAVDDPSLFFSTPERQLFPPFSAFYLLHHGHIQPWNEASIVEQLRGDLTRYNSQVNGGRYQWLGDQRGAWDADAYQLRFWPDSNITASLPPDTLLERLNTAYREQRTAPVFVVYPSGMEQFADLYPALEDSGIPFRWFTLAAGEPLHVGRYPAQFLDYGIYW